MIWLAACYLEYVTASKCIRKLVGKGAYTGNNMTIVATAINQNGERVSLFQVHERTYSQFGVNTEANIQKVKILFPVGKGPLI